MSVHHLMIALGTAGVILTCTRAKGNARTARSAIVMKSACPIAARITTVLSGVVEATMTPAMMSIVAQANIVTMDIATRSLIVAPTTLSVTPDTIVAVAPILVKLDAETTTLVIMEKCARTVVARPKNLAVLIIPIVTLDTTVVVLTLARLVAATTMLVATEKSARIIVARRKKDTALIIPIVTLATTVAVPTRAR